MSDSWLLRPYLPTLCPSLVLSCPIVATFIFCIIRNIDWSIYTVTCFSLWGKLSSNISLFLFYTRGFVALWGIFFRWLVSNWEELSSQSCWVWNLPLLHRHLDLVPVRLLAEGFLPWERGCLLARFDQLGGNKRFWGRRERKAKKLKTFLSLERKPGLSRKH